MKNSSEVIRHNKIIPLDAVPLLNENDFRSDALDLIGERCRVSSFFALKNKKDEYLLYLVISDDARGTLDILSMKPESGSFRSMTPDAPQFHLFEREIYEQTGIKPEGHPWLKPVRFPSGERAAWKSDTLPGSCGSSPLSRIGEMDFFRIEGDEIHEVAVGPIHAGIIEPGHFRFQCHGEKVYHLEISLGYQHRGIEKKLEGGPYKNSLYRIGAAAGDSTIAHSTAYCQNIEVLSETRISARSEAVRAVSLELERCANHIGDLGALAGDIGYLPTSSYCGRIRGDFLNMSALICGNRFGRGTVVPGGTDFDIDEKVREELLEKIDTGRADFLSAVSLLWDSPSVLARFDSTGRISRETAELIGMVGPAARASGCVRDIRKDHPSGSYRFSYLPVSVSQPGDVFSRAYIRWLEVQESILFIEKMLNELPEGDLRKDICRTLSPDSLTVSLVEGWRGEVCHTAVTDRSGRIMKYKIVDPSFHNWFGLSLALRGEEISDFPVCNKSFNLSYCGFDL